MVERISLTFSELQLAQYVQANCDGDAALTKPMVLKDFCLDRLERPKARAKADRVRFGGVRDFV